MGHQGRAEGSERETEKRALRWPTPALDAVSRRGIFDAMLQRASLLFLPLVHICLV